MQALRASDLLRIMGVNTHIGNTAVSPQYGNIPQIIGSLNYMGMPLIRDGAYNPSLFAQVARGTGAKFILMIGESAPTSYISDLNSNMVVGAQYIAALEGPNEPDSAYATSLGGSPWAAAAVAPAVQAAARLIKVPAIANSFANIWPDPGSYGTTGDLSGFYDLGNAHTYFDPHQCGPNGNGFFNLGMIEWVQNCAQLTVPNKPTAHTEFGWSTAKNSSLAISSYALIFWLSAHSMWQVPMACYYGLYDDTGGAWGLFDANGNPRPAATAIRYMREILADSAWNAATFTPGAPSITVTGLPAGENINAGGHTALYQKANGDYYLALWNEQRLTTEDGATPPNAPITVANIAVEVALPAVSNVDVFDPLVSVVPQSTHLQTASLMVALPAHPLFIRIRAA